MGFIGGEGRGSKVLLEVLTWLYLPPQVMGPEWGKEMNRLLHPPHMDSIEGWADTSGNSKMIVKTKTVGFPQPSHWATLPI